MDRRAFVTGAGAMLAARNVEAQQMAKLPRVGVLSPGVPPPMDPFDQRTVFETALRGLGWVPGTSVTIEYRYAQGDADRLVNHAA